MDKVTIYALNTLLVKEHLSSILSLINKTSIDKASKYIHEKDQLLSYGSSYLIKNYLPNKEIYKTKEGKPYFNDGPFFNISHSGELVVLAVNETNEIGVDIEKIDDKKADAIKFTLSEEEKDTNDVETLFRMWSNKESLIKCMSSNLNDIRKLNALPLEGLRIVNNEKYYSKSMIYEGYSLSVTLKQNEPFDVDIIKVDIEK